MTKQELKTHTLGDKLRQLRDERNLMQREVGAVIEVDGAFISKVENNEKPINRKHLTTLSKFFKVQEEELQTLWLADKIRLMIKDEPNALVALKNIIEGIEANGSN
ncbi:MAG TPA: helix-turn-helix transcriptional regulator [Chitinophagales bacterium]|nr:helix-turn-helix transcriptional regulator [Chitinophagales bacterium]